jgi:hypothetical protein
MGRLLSILVGGQTETLPEWIKRPLLLFDLCERSDRYRPDSSIQIASGSDRFWRIVLKKSRLRGSAPTLRNDDTIGVGLLNH